MFPGLFKIVRIRSEFLYVITETIWVFLESSALSVRKLLSYNLGDKALFELAKIEPVNSKTFHSLVK